MGTRGSCRRSPSAFQRGTRSIAATRIMCFVRSVSSRDSCISQRRRLCRRWRQIALNLQATRSSIITSPALFPFLCPRMKSEFGPSCSLAALPPSMAAPEGCTAKGRGPRDRSQGTPLPGSQAPHAPLDRAQQGREAACADAVPSNEAWLTWLQSRLTARGGRPRPLLWPMLLHCCSTEAPNSRSLRLPLLGPSAPAAAVAATRNAGSGPAIPDTAYVPAAASSKRKRSDGTSRDAGGSGAPGGAGAGDGAVGDTRGFFPGQEVMLPGSVDAGTVVRSNAPAFLEQRAEEDFGRDIELRGELDPDREAFSCEEPGLRVGAYPAACVIRRGVPEGATSLVPPGAAAGLISPHWV